MVTFMILSILYSRNQRTSHQPISTGRHGEPHVWSWVVSTHHPWV